MVLSCALRNENLLSASGDTSVLVRPGLFQLLSDLYFFYARYSALPLLYLPLPPSLRHLLFLVIRSSHL